MNPRLADKSVSIVARSPALDMDAVEAVVTLPTFRRPDQLIETLASLKAQRTGRRFAVVVMENDAEGMAGAKAARALFESGEIAGLLIVAHERGNCSAYNAGWQTALIHFPAFRHLLVIDDDETAGPDWLETMCATAERLGADIVGAPQVPVFPRPADAHWAAHPVFAPPYNETGPVRALYSSGNLLVGRHVLAAMGPPFLELAFNFMGGGDSDFLSRAAARGFRLAWCAEAPVFERVPERRLEADWVRARSLRNGVISTLVEQRKLAGNAFAGPRVFAHSFALLAAAPIRGLVRALRTGSVGAGLYPIHVGLGRVLAHFGYANEQYRNPEKN